MLHLVVTAIGVFLQRKRKSQLLFDAGNSQTDIRQSKAGSTAIVGSEPANRMGG